MRHLRMFIRRWLRRFGLMRPSTKFVARYLYGSRTLCMVINDDRISEVHLGCRLNDRDMPDFEVWEIL